MDIYGTAVTVITQVYQVTVFIQGVISDIKSFDEDRAEIRLKLQLQLSTLYFFRESFFNPEQGLMLPGKLPTWVANTVTGLLEQMRAVLADYERVGTKYGLVDSEVKMDDYKPDQVENTKRSLLERAKNKAQSLKLKGIDWSLFDKKKLNKILESYTEWTKSLQNLMQHMSQESLAHFIRDSAGAKSSGLEPVWKRQTLVDAKAPDDFHSLEGKIVEDKGTSGDFRLGQWSHKDTTMQVVVEYHGYDSMLLRDDLDPEEIEEYKAPLRNLAWLLQNSTFSDTEASTEETLSQPKIYALECLGFIDQPENERSVLLYKLPSVHKGGEVDSKLVSLHDFINAVDPKTKRPLKPSLNDRFNIAHCLALTVLNVHGSRWVHKNIWSKGVLLFNNADSVTASDVEHATDRDYSQKARRRMLAYLGDWGFARSLQQGTDMRSDFEIEPNLYRHPERQGRPTRQFARIHDIYALGVVLLEIGSWMTISKLMAGTIRDSEKSGRLPKAKRVREQFVSWATHQISKEIGESYAKAVVACLEGSFRNGSDMELSLDFSEKVVNVLARGVNI
ncbi:hypothetical protein ASPZODRAFT_11991 [Penicilliopsis zonata CBS 506.65]|uniref:Protein kinase domain-containing protein n=1 Tax=Penicilliopsis zonata CBS 506.65 TaxID=1073090 RepID=A0A1L9SVD2_9EURO|nr:hypothetical protein ASPZODRAFT_11991 [Penicilliopsis zonata CBS 506.65]OJJ51149.1 hypothetical protein ASPZODRAFT_11991 [Penicilliopsis zonata CBS 506.65]